MDLRPGVHQIDVLAFDVIRRHAAHAGFVTIELPAGIRDTAAFFDAARAALPLDPPLLGSGSWDALSDSLWEGLYTHPARAIAILWPDTRAMADAAPAALATALEVLADVAASLADPGATCNRPKVVAVIVERAVE